MVSAWARDLLMGRVEDDHLVDALVGMLLHPLRGAEALAQVLGHLFGARDVPGLGEDLVIGDVAGHLLLEHCPETIPRALAMAGATKVNPQRLEEWDCT